MKSRAHGKSFKVKKLMPLKDMDDYNNFFNQPIPEVIELESPRSRNFEEETVMSMPVT